MLMKRKKIPQYVHFRCRRVHTNRSLKQTGISYKLQTSLLKQEMEHDEFHEDTLEARKNERLSYVENDVLSSASCHVRYTIDMEELNGFGIKNNLILSSLANKAFNSLRYENDETINIYTDSFMRKFVRNSTKGDRCIAFIQ